MIGKFVHGEGPISAKILICGEGPGKMESSIGRPFVGLSGSDLNRYLLMQAGLRREEVYITNIVKFRTDEANRDPNADEIARDEHYLLEEIAKVKPEIIVPVGRIATEYFQGPCKLEFVHALPIPWSKNPNITVLGVYHPAAGLHQADRYSQLVYNSFKRLGAYLRGDLRLAVDNIHPDYKTTASLQSYKDFPIGMDTEGTPLRPWGASYTWGEGWANVCFPEDAAKGFNPDGPVVFHNALWDIPVLRAMGVNLDLDKIEDTMLIAHLLCVEPKKLKALAYRECGMEMEEYLEVIKEADERIAKEYLERALSRRCSTCSGSGEITRPWKKNPNKTTSDRCHACYGDGTSWGRPKAQLVFNDDFTAKLYQPESVGRRLASILQCDSDFRAKWKDLGPELVKPVEDQLGPIPEVSLDDVEPRQRVIDYSARDADATLRVYHRLRPRLASMGLEKAYEIDKGCIPIIDRMHSNGILIDKDYFYALDKQFEKEQYAALDKLYSELGLYFNPASPIQAKREIEKLGIKDLDSTNERTLKLQKIKAKDPKVGRVIDLCLDYRELNKLRGTYAQPLPKQADENSRIHTSFILAAYEKDGETHDAPSTGRFSSRNPNLQNIPVATDRGNLIRAGFIARPGCKLLSVDLSQIELRVGAHLSGDTNMIEAFRSGKDLHTLTASKMFGVPYDQVDPKKHRYPAKTISFGVFYGMSKYRLQGELAIEGLVISLDEAQAFIDAWFDTYPSIRTYMHNVHAEARQNSFVRTMYGRIRYLPNVHCKDDRIREEALRKAGNFPVQGGSADLLKLGLHDILCRTVTTMEQLGYYCQPILTIHDEIILEVESSKTELIAKEVIYDFEQVGIKYGLSVPIVATAKAGPNWASLEPLSF